MEEKLWCGNGTGKGTFVICDTQSYRLVDHELNGGVWVTRMVLPLTCLPKQNNCLAILLSYSIFYYYFIFISALPLFVIIIILFLLPLLSSTFL